MKYLLDTCVVSETRRREPNASLMNWLAERQAAELFVSVVTLGELRKGACSLKDASRRQILEEWIDEDVATCFNGRILGFERSIADRWGRLMGEDFSEFSGAVDAYGGFFASEANSSAGTVYRKTAADNGVLTLRVHCYNPYRKTAILATRRFPHRWFCCRVLREGGPRLAHAGRLTRGGMGGEYRVVEAGREVEVK